MAKQMLDTISEPSVNNKGVVKQIEPEAKKLKWYFLALVGVAVLGERQQSIRKVVGAF